MKRFAIALALAASTAAATAQALQHPSLVEVFANTAMLVQAPQSPSYPLRIYRLDAMALIEEQLSQGLPAVEADAAAYLMRIEAEIRRKYGAQIVNAANGMTMAIHYRLDRLPAVVIDRRSVIYGVPDVQQALAIYQQHSGGNP